MLFIFSKCTTPVSLVMLVKVMVEALKEMILTIMLMGQRYENSFFHVSLYFSPSSPISKLFIFKFCIKICAQFLSETKFPLRR